MAARFYGRQPATAVAVTGTSGKTSVADSTRQIFAGLGHSAASLGTIGIVRPDGGIYGSLTTPDPVTLHAVIAGLADDSVSHLAFEASSHGLDQRRLDGVTLAAAAFTNLGRDHLDYHPSVEHYLAASCACSIHCCPKVAAPSSTSTMPTPPGSSRSLSGATSACSRSALILPPACNWSRHSRRLRATIGFCYGGQDYSVELGLIGAYQASNALIAAGLVTSTGESAEAVFQTLGSTTRCGRAPRGGR